MADIDARGSHTGEPVTTDSDLYYDPYDFEIDADPYPIWRRLREERPLYYNERYDFYALTRFDDVERGLIEWKTYSSAKGTLLELIKGGIEIPPGSIIFEDPPGHNIHRGLLSRVFTPRKMNAIEPKIREFCARSLDPHGGHRRVRLHRRPGCPDAHAHHRDAARDPRAGPGGPPGEDRRQPPPGRGHHARRLELRSGRAGQQLRRLHRLAGRAPV